MGCWPYLILYHRAVRNRLLTDVGTRISHRWYCNARPVLLACQSSLPAAASVLLLGWVCLSSIILVILLSYKPRWLQPILPASTVVMFARFVVLTNDFKHKSRQP